MFSVFVDNNCNKHRQTSRLFAGTHIQTSCNFERNISSCKSYNNPLGFLHCPRNNGIPCKPPCEFLVG